MSSFRHRHFDIQVLLKLPVDRRPIYRAFKILTRLVGQFKTTFIFHEDSRIKAIKGVVAIVRWVKPRQSFCSYPLFFCSTQLPITDLRLHGAYHCTLCTFFFFIQFCFQKCNTELNYFSFSTSADLRSPEVESYFVKIIRHGSARNVFSHDCGIQ